MHISSLKVSNYKSFRESDPINLSKGFNIIVGKNNSGKTALAEACTLDIEDKPHRSEATIPHQGASHPHRSEVDVGISLKGIEIERHMIDRGGNFTIPRGEDEDAGDRTRRFLSEIKGNNIIEAIVKSNSIDSRNIEKERGAQIKVRRGSRELRSGDNPTRNYATLHDKNERG